MANYTISKTGVDFIKQWEGLSLTAYQGKADRKGVITIGYGHTNLAGTPPVPKLGMKITEAEATEILDRDLDKAERAVNRLVKVPLEPNEFTVLVSFVHNLGEGALQGSTLLKELNRGNKEKVPTELLKWVNSKVNGKMTRIPGLVNRRAAEAGLWAKGKFVSSATPDVVRTNEPVLTKENVALAGGFLSSIGFSQVSGPIAYALAGIMVVAAIAFAVSWYMKKDK